MFLAETNTLVSPLFWAMQPYLAAMVVVLVIGAFKAEIKGWLGEWAVNRKLATQLDPQLYQNLPNLMLHVNGATSQIDHVVLSPFGIFVIETKNYRGWIFGKVDEKLWTKKIYRSTFTFPNPIRQNAGHISALMAATGLPKAVFHSVVVFMCGTEFKSNFPPNVLHAAELIAYIRSYTQRVLEVDHLPAIRANLERAAASVTAKQRANHVPNIRKRIGK